MSALADVGTAAEHRFAGLAGEGSRPAAHRAHALPRRDPGPKAGPQAGPPAEDDGMPRTALRVVLGADPSSAGPAERVPGRIAEVAHGAPAVHLVPSPPPARPRPATTPRGGPPLTLVDRLEVLKAHDRLLALEAEDRAAEGDDREAAPAADPALVVRRLATASVEVITGARPAAQLARWLTPGVLDALRSRSGATRPAALRVCRAPACRGVRVYALEPRVVEATAVVDDGRRVRAVAVRLEAHRGAWRATALEIG